MPLVPKSSSHVVQVDLLKDVPGLLDLVVKRYPWMRDEDGEQVARMLRDLGPWADCVQFLAEMRVSFV